MLTISPFRALMPPPANAGQVAAVPYDVVSTAEAADLAADNPLSFLRVSRPEIELPEGTDVHADVVYERAAANFDRLKTAAQLEPDAQASFYIYSMERNGKRQSGLVVAASVDDYDEGRIQQHEKTRRDKEDDRTRHTMAVRAHSGPVFLVCRSTWSMDSSIQEVMGADSPLFDVTADDGTLHQIWRVPEAYNHLLQVLFQRTRAMYIADGHHRAKSASRVREECRSANPDHTGEEAYNRFLAVIFPHNQVRILPYNRLVHDLKGLSPKALLNHISERFDVAPAADGIARNKRDIHMYLDGQWYTLNAISVPADATPSELLDVSILQDQLLSPLLGIEDPRTSERLSFVGGVRGTDYLSQQVDNGAGAVAFSMYPTTVEELMAISERGEIMPPKSTWFEPKLRDGLLIHCF